MSIAYPFGMPISDHTVHTCNNAWTPFSSVMILEIKSDVSGKEKKP